MPTPPRIGSPRPREESDLPGGFVSLSHPAPGGDSKFHHPTSNSLAEVGDMCKRPGVGDQPVPPSLRKRSMNLVQTPFPEDASQEKKQSRFSLDLQVVKRCSEIGGDCSSTSKTPKSVRIVGISPESSPDACSLVSHGVSSIVSNLLEGRWKGGQESAILLSLLRGGANPSALGEELHRYKSSTTPRRASEPAAYRLLKTALFHRDTLVLIEAYLKNFGEGYECYSDEWAAFSKYLFRDKRLDCLSLFELLLDYAFPRMQPETPFRENSWYVRLLTDLLNTSFDSEYWEKLKKAVKKSDQKESLAIFYATPIPESVVLLLDKILQKALMHGWECDAAVRACSGMFFTRVVCPFFVGFERTLAAKYLSKLIEGETYQEKGGILDAEQHDTVLEALKAPHQEFMAKHTNLIAYLSQ